MYAQLRRSLRLLARALGETGGILRNRPVDGREIVTTFLWWKFLRAVFHRGYVLASGLYFVLTAQLSASQIVFLGTVMSIILVLSDIPAGVWSDAIGRKWPLVIGQMLLAIGMMMTGVVTAFSLIVVTQVFWGLGWAFLTGTDIAWVTDELDQPHQIAQVLTASARFELAGGAIGMIVFGVLSWGTSLAIAIVVSGIAMALLGLFVAVRFTERKFVPIQEKRWSASLSIFRRGMNLSRHDHEILLVFVATMLINGAAIVGWLYPKQLVNLGFPSDPILWYTALGILSSALGVVALHIVEAHITGVGVARRMYALTCFVGMLGLIVLAEAPNAIIGSIGVLLVGGVAFNVTRTVSVIWVNWRTASEVRATLHSFLSQAESIGEIIGGFALAILAQATSISIVLIASGALIAFTGMIVAWLSADRANSGSL
jgi:MFS family permease